MAIVDENLGQCQSFFFEGKHLLVVSIVKYEEGLRVPLFVLVQQPAPILKYSYESNPKAFAIIMKEKAKKSFETSFPPQFTQGVRRIKTDALPVSFRFPAKEDTEAAGICKWNPGHTIEDAPKVKAVDFDKLTKFERQQGWYIEVKDRPKGTIKDTFYKHLQSNLKCRSKVEVYYFIETGKRPTHGDTRAYTAEINKDSGDSKKRIRGAKLLEMREVGLYDEDEKKIIRWPVMPTESQATTSKYANIGKKKRKREAQGVRDSKDANSNPTSLNIYTLYDCQTLV